MSKEATTPGSRLFEIRLAYGDGVRTPEPLKAFSARVTRVTGELYHAATLSLLERMEQGWKLDDFNALAKLDKKQRGAPWLAFGIVVPDATELDVSELEVPDPRKDRKLTMQEIARAERQAELERSAQQQQARGGRGPKKRPRGGAA